MIPAGKYLARATGGQLAITGNDKEQMAVALEIQRGPQAGQSLTWYGYFTDLSSERTMESLRYLGWTGTDLADLEGLGTNTVEIVVEHDEYNGRVSAKVQWINQVGGVAVKNAMDDSKAQAFAEKMRAKAAAIPQSLAEQSEPPPFDEADPGPDSPPPDDDNIPF